MLFEDKTQQIIKAFYTVYNKLGYGFLEKVYHNALLFELEQSGFDVKSLMITAGFKPPFFRRRMTRKKRIVANN